jgi:hypothetical protein
MEADDMQARMNVGYSHLHLDQLGKGSIATDSPGDSNPFDHPPHVRVMGSTTPASWQTIEP